MVNLLMEYATDKFFKCKEQLDPLKGSNLHLSVKYNRSPVNSIVSFDHLDRSVEKHKDRSVSEVGELKDGRIYRPWA